MSVVTESVVGFLQDNERNHQPTEQKEEKQEQ